MSGASSSQYRSMRWCRCAPGRGARRICWGSSTLVISSPPGSGNTLTSGWWKSTVAPSPATTSIALGTAGRPARLTYRRRRGPGWPAALMLRPAMRAGWKAVRSEARLAAQFEDIAGLQDRVRPVVCLNGNGREVRAHSRLTVLWLSDCQSDGTTQGLAKVPGPRGDVCPSCSARWSAAGWLLSHSRVTDAMARPPPDVHVLF
jgi:hypothetical protein